MKQMEEDTDRAIQDEITGEADITDGHLDPVVNQQYQQKLNAMKARDRAEFFNSDESDVDINSDNDTSSKKQQFTESQEGSSSIMAEEEEKKQRGLRGFFRRMTVTETHNDTESLNSEGVPKRNFLKRLALGEPDEFDEKFEGDNIFEKFVNLSGGGLAPGATKSDLEKQNDEEAQRNNEEGIQLQQLDPELFKKEAVDIINAHSSQQKNKVDHSDETTLTSSVNTGDSSFLAPNPDYYLRDEDNIYELQLDDGGESYVAPPERVRGGVLSSLLRLYQNPTEASRSRLQLSGSEAPSPTASGAVTPTPENRDQVDMKSLSERLKTFAGGHKRKVIIDDGSAQEQMGHRKTASFSDLSILSPDRTKGSKKNESSTYLPTFKGSQRPKLKKAATGRIKTKREHAKAKITVHIADILQRQRFILRMCKALMLYGAPTHRLEEYLTMTARVLEIDAQFIYFPGCMIVSFGDPTTRTSEVQLVRCSQGLDLYKLHRVHRIYKKVIHDLVGVEDASNNLDDLLSQKPTFPPWACVLIYAFSASMVTPFAFGGGWVNLPVSFCIGLCVGGLQFLIAPRSNLYSNVFEVTASIVVSFIGRALGSIEGSHICFSAVVQGSLALILPGYIILCGSLELQSRNLVAGSVRMFYAIIYSLFLGFGITLGAALYGWIDKNATSETTCSEQISPWFRLLFVPMFTIGLGLINQARLFQLPVMLFISCAGYVVNYFTSKHFSNSTEFTAAVSSFVIGVLGNLYSRLYKGIAVSAMLPAIFVQVPSGIASQSSLLAGVQSANQIVSNTTTTASSSADNTSGISFGITMIQVAIGISVGLFASTIAVYPLGKRSTSVFTL
jgi:uncharacterized membrane protein YjjP (DUF1212 family)